MIPLSINMLFPYLTLGLLVAALFVLRSRPVIYGLLGVQTAVGFLYGIMDLHGLLALGVFWGICEFHWRNRHSQGGLHFLGFLIIITLAIGFSSHLIPGFHNLQVIKGLTLSPSSSPFNLYLNFDKTMMAVILVASRVILFPQARFSGKVLGQTIVIATLCLGLLIPLALLSGYVQFDPKFPDSFGLWALNNLLFVCFAEEVVFRGVIQNYLMQVSNRRNLPTFIPLFVSALLFGVLLPGHFYGGPLYMGFATLAGLFYGYAYYKTARLESAILVHFLLNLGHFLFFSYPMAVGMVK